jgi:diketogulonate reductase-like aldo/keto reductase
MDINKKVKLNNGVEIPLLGLGLWENNEQSVLDALECGYRLIDTASMYGNEREVGNAIKKSKIPREEIFVTTKIWNSEQNDPLKAFNNSLKKLNLDYLDLYLIHWPMSERIKTWKVFEKLLEEDKCKAIGVSNFTINHLKELFNHSNTIPMVNQVEFSPYLYQKDLLDFCRENKIQLQAYSPLTRGEKLNDPKLIEIAKKYNKTTAQLLIKWALQHNIVVIPKSSNKKRIYENSQVFDFNISKEDMNILDNFNEDSRHCWDPTEII